MENNTTFKINGEYIELLALLKALGIAQTGGHAKMIVDSEEVTRNGSVELRRRAKCIKGDLISVGDQKIQLT
ncbi:MAG: RNA-binding S4 domain-containing protein [Crocinitomicaceae bacterium]|nr:RNA-binding S4 domain-containing protein [Crocinitomicaceae bacterium]OUT68205.1 MAG: RNA-binding protein [Crocinitomicaceae bacterium TMED16]|tara:strand:- start:3 stop:218 length:216 start_codon:yes stop_codon:yes gene_type:complete